MRRMTDSDMYDLDALQLTRRSVICSSSTAFRSLLNLASLSRPAMVLSSAKGKFLKVLIAEENDATTSELESQIEQDSSTERSSLLAPSIVSPSELDKSI
jgi:hypothetical protein